MCYWVHFIHQIHLCFVCLFSGSIHFEEYVAFLWRSIASHFITNASTQVNSGVLSKRKSSSSVFHSCLNITVIIQNEVIFTHKNANNDNACVWLAIYFKSSNLIYPFWQEAKGNLDGLLYLSAMNDINKLLQNCFCSLKRPKKFQAEDRLFSLSSVTSPAVCILQQIGFQYLPAINLFFLL